MVAEQQQVLILIKEDLVQTVVAALQVIVDLQLEPMVQQILVVELVVEDQHHLLAVLVVLT